MKFLKGLQKGWGLAVAGCGMVVSLPVVGLLPPKAASGVAAVCAAVLAANGALVANGHKD
jgi:hypothetical protein